MMMMNMAEMWASMGSAIASIIFIYTMFQQFCPNQLRDHFDNYTQRLISFFNPYIHISFHEFTGERMERSNVYTAIETYLTLNSSKLAKKLKADIVNDSKDLVLSMDDYEQITDTYNGVQLWWASRKSVSISKTFSFYATDADERRFYMLSFHRRHRKLVTKSYLNHVREQGKKMEKENRQRKLYTNNKSENWNGYRRTMWSHVVFDHPSTFETLAMDPKKKKEIIDDLMTFREGKEYYAKVGKAWKRGYLLHGPPGTGKSSMVAAMANLLGYDVYDLELTAVTDNTQLKKLWIEISSKSIIVIEDIDCSLDLTGQRKKEKEKDKEEEKKDDPVTKKAKEEEKLYNKDSKVTLSGLLNFIDGLWSSCGGERLIVFTTNFVDQLDPALIRRGRMDRRIKLSYCCFETFKVLARNYLDVESHQLFETIRELLQETQMTPAEVAENLMPKSVPWDAESCLENLIQALRNVKEEARLKAEKEKEQSKSSSKEEAHGDDKETESV